MPAVLPSRASRRLRLRVARRPRARAARESDRPPRARVAAALGVDPVRLDGRAEHAIAGELACAVRAGVRDAERRRSVRIAERDRAADPTLARAHVDAPPVLLV